MRDLLYCACSHASFPHFLLLDSSNTNSPCSIYLWTQKKGGLLAITQVLLYTGITMREL